MTEPAERSCLASSRVGPDADLLLDAVASLPWLAPSSGSLAAWCRSPSLPTWVTHLRHDPAAALLLVRTAPASVPDHFPGAAIDALAPLEFAARLLASPPRGFIDWADPIAAPIHRMSVTIAAMARSAVERAGRGNPDMAWVAGLLAPLGWMAALVFAPRRVSACLGDKAMPTDPVGTQRRYLGVGVHALTRRLARLWNLPEWLSGVLGRLALPLDHARRLGADPVLFAAVRLAIDAARRCGVETGLVLGTDLAEEERLLGRIEQMPADVAASERKWDDPYRQTLLPDLLAVALERGRLRRAPVLARLERETDGLHEALCEQVHSEANRLHEAKLSALAEFAAGAGHEINNPLAVISGQAQYVMHHKDDWLAADTEGMVKLALENIINQTKRIHNILRDLMQFARPASSRPVRFDIPTLLGEVATSLAELAEQKRVSVEVRSPEQLLVHADENQVRQALTCLLRNAIEAAAGGWARLVLNETGERVEVCVEDSGPGPSVEQVPHLFEPFYSGRSAGRGKGLGLPVAWRLARQQGGDVLFVPAGEGQPTRFVLVLPRVESEQTKAA